MSQQGAQPQQPFVQPVPAYPYMVMPTAERNGLGVFGFLVALVGLAVPTGLVSLLGLMICLVAMGRRPRGFASVGVVLGLIGSLAWLVVSLVVVVVGVLAVAATGVALAAGFLLVQPEVVEITSDMVNVAIAAKEHEKDQNQRPGDLGQLALATSTLTDPWGTEYRYELVDAEPGFELTSAGRDGEFGTQDDVSLSGLDRMWESAFEDFGHKMEQLGERLESLEEAGGLECGDDQILFRWNDRARIYRHRASAEVVREH
ncbi:MAG: type II secretion system protein GspG [Planctomycetota bacterium]|jgi:hypothetical protein